jgi:hypothetical protein
MVEESMGSLGIDSRCLDIRVTAGREEERSTTELLVGKERKNIERMMILYFN